MVNNFHDDYEKGGIITVQHLPKKHSISLSLSLTLSSLLSLCVDAGHQELCRRGSHNSILDEMG